MTPTAFSRHIGVDESTVREAISQGRLDGAIGEDGQITDVAKAMELWDANRLRPGPRAATQPDTLVEARRQRQQASINNLRDSVDDLRSTLIDPKLAAQIIAGEFEVVARHLRRLPQEVAPRAAGLAPHLAIVVIRECANRTLSAIVASALVDSPRRTRVSAGSDGQSLTELTIEQTQLTATRMGLMRAMQRGDVVHVKKLAEGIAERLAELRSSLNALPGRVAQRFESLDTVGALALLEDEVGAIVAGLGAAPMTILPSDDEVAQFVPNDPPKAPRRPDGSGTVLVVNSRLQQTIRQAGFARTAATQDEVHFARQGDGATIIAKIGAHWELLRADGEITEGRGAPALQEALEG